jgi:hypothetical protein
LVSFIESNYFSEKRSNQSTALSDSLESFADPQRPQFQQGVEDQRRVSHSFRDELTSQLMEVEILYLLSLGARSGYDLRKQLIDCFDTDVS